MTIKDKKLATAMQRAGLSDYELVKGKGYFYVINKDGEIFGSIYVYSYKQLTANEWVERIKEAIND